MARYAETTSVPVDWEYLELLTTAHSGTGPAGEACRTCRHCVMLPHSSKMPLKCSPNVATVSIVSMAEPVCQRLAGVVRLTGIIGLCQR